MAAARWAGFLSSDPRGRGPTRPTLANCWLGPGSRAEERRFAFPEFQKSTSGLPDGCKERTCVRRTLNLTGLCGQ